MQGGHKKDVSIFIRAVKKRDALAVSGFCFSQLMLITELTNDGQQLLILLLKLFNTPTDKQTHARCITHLRLPHHHYTAVSFAYVMYCYCP